MRAKVRPSHGDDPHLIAVFLAEKGAGAGLDRFFLRHQPCFDGRIVLNDLIGQRLDARKLLFRERLGMGEIETQTFGRDERTLLRNMVAQNLTQRFMQNMRRGMIGARRAAPGVIDLEFERKGGCDLALLDFALMDDEVAEFLERVVNPEAQTLAANDADVAELSARFPVEGRLIEDDRAARALLEDEGFGSVMDESGDDPFALLGLIAEEFGCADAFLDCEPQRLRRGFA